VDLQELSLDDLRVESFPITETNERAPWTLGTYVVGCKTTYVGYTCNDTDTCMFTCGSTCPDGTCTCPP
jgi:hypothetical protein